MCRSGVKCRKDYGTGGNIMKKILATLLGTLILLSLLSGCQKEADVPDSTEISTETMLATEVTTALTETTEATTEATAEATTEATTGPVVNDTVFRAGTWMAQCGPTSRYYFFEAGGDAGRFINMKDSTGADFTYMQTGDQGVFYLSANGAGAACSVVVQDEDHIILKWENQPEEKMTYVSPLDEEQFHFYTHEELARLALADYLAKNYPVDVSLQAAAMDNGDGTSTIQIYQNLGDHNSTAAYYVVDRCTGEGQNISNGTSVDLTKGTQDLDIYYRYLDAPLSPDIPCLVLSETEYTNQIILHPLVTVKDFRVVSLSYVENGEDYGFQVLELLYEAASMGPETGMILLVELPEIIPNVGVIYKDRNGEERLYAVMYSGLDGSVLLVEQMLV